jgi:UDP-2,4-diacetamido-2,4,6-trideoxy-beta-L-altropyranose hydrolase
MPGPDAVDRSRDERPRVVLRADGGAAVGLGHVRRQLALARAMAGWADCRLVLGDDAPTAAWARARGVPCDLVDAGMEATLAVVSAARAGALVVDTYAFSPADLAMARDAVPTLVVIDDHGVFPVAGHLVVNAAAGVRAPDEEPDRYLLGPRFALLDPAFAVPPARSWRAQVERALLVLGAAPAPALMGRLAASLARALPGAAIDLVVGPGADRAALDRALRGIDGLEVRQAPEDMRALMLAADVAVTAGGVTLLELAATGAPIVGVCVAANQRANLRGLAAEGALLDAGAAEDAELCTTVERALGGLRLDAARRRALGERARRLVDGRGAERVAEAVRARLGACAVVR